MTYGLLCYVSHHLFGTTAGVEVGQYLGDVAASFGTMYEPNLFGAYSGCFAVLFLALYLSSGEHRSGHLVGFLLAALASASSFSRASLLAVIVSVGWVLWKTRHFRAKSPTGDLFCFWVRTGLAVSLMGIGGVLRERISALYYQGLTEETAISRVLVIQQAIEELPNHLLLGKGTASFNRLLTGLTILNGQVIRLGLAMPRSEFFMILV